MVIVETIRHFKTIRANVDKRSCLITINEACIPATKTVSPDWTKVLKEQSDVRIILTMFLDLESFLY